MTVKKSFKAEMSSHCSSHSEYTDALSKVEQLQFDHYLLSGKSEFQLLEASGPSHSSAFLGGLTLHKGGLTLIPIDAIDSH